MAKQVSSWNLEASVLWDIARAFCDDRFSGTLHARLNGFIRSRNVAGLCSCDLPDPAKHGRDFVNLRQLQAFFKKNAWFSNDALCSETARKGFLQAEALCRITNKRLDFYHMHRDRLDPDVQGWIKSAQSFIRRVLGDVNVFLDQIPDLVKVTGGATEDRARRRALPFLKISRTIRAPRRALPLVSTYLHYVGNKRPLRMQAIDCNRVEFVPKNYKTHRTIACEPTAAVPFQLAFDTYAKRKMRRFGCDLSDQKVNQELSRIGSITGEFATIDLSMASDTLSLNCVALLLPPEWFSLLSRLRCTHYCGKGVGTGKYAKFSSMGNGLTFALESLVFLSVIRAVGSKRGTTYGDDIIVETDRVVDLVKFLRFLGFRVNSDKSFISGPFRESCGTDWINGSLVTPFYIRSLPHSPAQLCHLINGLVKVASPFGRLWNLLRDLSRGLPLVPESEDSMTGIHISYSKAQNLGLIVNNSKALGPFIPASRQFKEVPSVFEHVGVRSYLIFLLFGKRVSCGIRKRADGRILVDEPSSFTMWNTGLTRRHLTMAAVRPWSSNFSAMDLWEAFLTER